MRLLTSLAFLGVLALLAPGADDAKLAAPARYFSTYPPTPETPLEPRVQDFLKAIPRVTNLETQSVADLREQSRKFIERVPKLDEAVAKVDDRQIPGPAGSVPVRVYTPEGTGPFPILLYLHGGGWVRGGLDNYNDLCRSLAHRAGCLVVSVAYRLAPETKFPGAVEDCFAALQWCAQHGEELNGDGKRLAVAGDSAGGNLSAALALYSRDKKGPPLALQVLIYPVLHRDFDTISYHDFAEGYGLSRNHMKYYWKQYLPKPEDARNAYAAPLAAEDVKGLPPALILAAQYDVLRDEAEAYAARLHRAGVPVHCTRYLGLAHGFISLGGMLEQSKHGLDEIAGALRKAFEPSTTTPFAVTEFSTYPPTEVAPLHPSLKERTTAALKGKPAHLKTLAELRKDTLDRAAKAKKLNEPVAKVEDRKVPGPAGAPPVSVRVYTPEGQGPFPILLFIHGGGWVRGTLDTVDDGCRSLCHHAKCLVVSVGYRLAPETKFPGGLHDCYAALKWCAEHAAEINGDGSRLAVTGSSAGGNLTACLALYARDQGGPKIALQIPVSPVMNDNFDSASYHQCAQGYGLSRPQMINYWRYYLAKPKDADNPYVAPIKAKDLKGVAPTLMMVAQYDVLRDEAEAYAARLAREGVPVQCTRYLGLTHGLGIQGAAIENSRHARDEMVAALKKAWGQ
jgi:acetyl esterase